jgi:acyl-CoA oxidase
MPGIEVGDIGPKMGYNLVDNGYCRFDHVRVPRKNMLARYQYVNEAGEYQRTKTIKKDDKGVGDKLKYIVMITTRISMVAGAYVYLAKAATIAVRYSAIRQQGFKNTREDSLTSGENVIIDYQVQQYRVFKALSMSYAFYFTNKMIRNKMLSFMKNLEAGDVNELPDLHATAAGLKAFCTNLCGDQIEECRRCLGGQGASLSSGVAKMLVDYNSVNPLAEGDKIILALQTARFLVRGAQAAKQNKPLAGSAKYLGEEVPAPDFSDKGLKSLESLLSAFRWRARNSAHGVAAQFQQRLTSGEEFDVAWNNCAVALVRASEHHCFYVMLLNFAQGVKSAKDAPVRKVLERLAIHFALVQIRENAADWLPHVSAKQNEAIHAAVSKLLSEIRPDAVALVDAFGWKDSSLLSALGRYDGNVYEALYEYARQNPMNKEEYIDEVWREQLSKVLDKEYLKKGKEEQRVGPIVSKL